MTSASIWDREPELEKVTAFDPWERRVTICIAAVAGLGTDDPAIVSCTDWLVSSEIGSANTMLKQRLLHHGIHCLTAGYSDEILAMMPLLRRATREVPHVDDANVGTVISSALLARKQQKIEELVGARLGITYDELKQHGKDRFPANIFQDIMARIN